ncbi:MAG TPA: glucose-6-phosphate dehydrogenase, partial [Terriglobia bacterium]|nr:glucose-6-phosphate dehydrogenase [Terriglobia bacterium]
MTEPPVVLNALKTSPQKQRTPQPCVMVIFGASGDLTERKLIPALYYLFRQKLLPDGFSVVGCARTPYTNDSFRDRMREAVTKYLNVPAEDSSFIESFHQGIYYLTDDFGDPKAYEQLAQLLDQLDRERGTQGNRLFYMATPPSFFQEIVTHLGAAGLNKPKIPDKSWTRIVVEKPFGRDLESAQELNRTLTSVFSEDQVYRIDHYLGKETVQNLLVFRFANGVFEPTWNRRYIDNVQIAVGEQIGIEGRGSYYEEAGLVRDMIQNHVLSVLSLVAMEPPSMFESGSVRDEKAKLMRAIRPIPLDRLGEAAVRGQYVEGWADGKKLPAYRAEPDVSPQSTTETFAAFKFYIDNWRWADVPFYVRAGKRLPKRISEITIQFRRAPHLLFRGTATKAMEPNLLSVRIQPDEGISLRFNAKIPDTTMHIKPVDMQFKYGEAFSTAAPPTAYETLLLDCMLGDPMLFT